jgi:hypothetical protein
MSIKAIETSYAGHLFRSRLEARWAVFFDTLGVKWEYEAQGFELPSGATYLPDFRLPDLKMWVEVKGDEGALRDSGARLAEFVMHQDDNGLLILGPVPDVAVGLPQHFVLTRHTHCCGQPVLCLDVAWADMLRHAAGVHEVGFPCTDLMNHRADALPALRNYGRGQAKYTNPGQIADWPIAAEDVKAYRAARSARFEHGQVGAML